MIWFNTLFILVILFVIVIDILHLNFLAFSIA